jgi:hypothetical protein
LLEALKSFGEGSAQELCVGDFSREEGSIRVIEDFPLDIFTIMNGNTYTDLLTHSRIHRVGDTAIRFLGPTGLILLKENSLRPKDQLDVQMLKQISDLDPEG